MVISGVVLALALRSLVPGHPGSRLVLLGWSAPAAFIVGVVVFVRGLAWSAAVISVQNILFSGLLMLVVGGFPWAYTPLIIGDGGMEGSGMLGTLIFIFIGIPGILATTIGSSLGGWHSE